MVGDTRRSGGICSLRFSIVRIGSEVCESVREWLIVRRFGTKTDFISTVQGQCAAGILQQPLPAGFGGEAGLTTPLTASGIATPSVAVNMNQLGTVYATKRRRRNGKRLVISSWTVILSGTVLLSKSTDNKWTAWRPKWLAYYICIQTTKP